MDYGRLFLFVAAATAVMAIGTHLWCWVYRVVERAVFRRKLADLCQALDLECLEDEKIDQRRAVAPRYQTWEQAMGDFRGGVPLDDILDRLNGQFPPRAAEIQKPGPVTPSGSLNMAVNGPTLTTVLFSLATLAVIFGIGLKQEGVEFLIREARKHFGGDPPKSPAPGGKV